MAGYLVDRVPIAHECTVCIGEVGPGASERCEIRTEHVRNWMEVLARSTGVSLSHLPTFCGRSPPPALLSPRHVCNRDRQCIIIVRTIKKSNTLHNTAKAGTSKICRKLTRPTGFHPGKVRHGNSYLYNLKAVTMQIFCMRTKTLS